MTAILEKDALASQPTLSRFFNRMDEDTLSQLNQVIRELRKIIYSKKTEIHADKPHYLLPVSSQTKAYDNEKKDPLKISIKLPPKVRILTPDHKQL